MVILFLSVLISSNPALSALVPEENSSSAITVYVSTSASTLASGSASPSALSNGRVSTSIQEAIDIARPGDRIEVTGGTYFENVVVSKRVSLIGIGRPVIDAGQKGSAITITADGGGVLVEGFAIRNSSLSSIDLYEPAGIRLQSDGNTIRGNIISGNWDDIVLFSSHNNTISNNTLAGSQEGLDLISSHDNAIFDNSISNAEDGIFMDSSNRNAIKYNIMQNCSDDGLICVNGSYNTI